MKNFLKSMFAFLLVAGTAGAFVPTNVYAANTYTPVDGGTVQFEKYLIYDSNAVSPEITFDFTLTASGNEKAPSATGIAIYSGDNAGVTVKDSTKAAVTVGNATFTNTTTKYDSVQAVDSTINLGQHATTVNDPIDLTKDSSGSALPQGKSNSYSRVPVTIDFTNVQFNEPGIYRWKVTENDNAAASAIGISKDAADHFIDVYVESTGFTPANTAGSGVGTLRIAGYVFHANADYQPTALAPVVEPASGKAMGFTNYFDTYDVTINMTVAGNQAAHDKYFKYTVSFDEIGGGTKVLADGSFDRTTANVASNTSTKSEYKGITQPEALVATSYGTIQHDYYLQHNQSVTFTGIPKNALVTIIEDQEDYTTTLTSDGTFLDNEPFVSPTNTTAMFGLISDVEFSFVNSRFGTIPTGIISNVLPGMMIALAGIAGVVIAINRRKAEQE